ncbi:MAG TPA: hypothetical protein VEJ67_07390 [Candidatus Cybelea sp.]|nr:hypothetical protein [Candidatus Cybelea sp.]
MSSSFFNFFNLSSDIERDRAAGSRNSVGVFLPAYHPCLDTLEIREGSVDMQPELGSHGTFRAPGGSYNPPQAGCLQGEYLAGFPHRIPLGHPHGRVDPGGHAIAKVIRVRFESVLFVSARDF